MYEQFFHPKNRPNVLKLFKFDTAEQARQFKNFFQGLYVILCVLNSRDLVKVDDFRSYCRKIHSNFNKTFRWMKDNETMHAVLGKVLAIMGFSDKLYR